MKTRTVASTLAALLLGASLSACGGADTTSDLSPSADDTAGEFDQVEAQITSCDDQQYDHWRYLSALAVAAGNELGRWNAAKDFTSQWNGIQLSSEGQARCANGCPNILAILSLQSDESRVIPRHDPALIRQYMKSFFDRQVNWNKSNAVPDHKLVLDHVSNATCGFRYHFKATKAGTDSALSGSTTLKAKHSNKCVSTSGSSVVQNSCNGASSQSFSFEVQSDKTYRIKNAAGQCLQTGSGSDLMLAGCGTTSTQKFAMNDKGNGEFEVKNTANGQCLDVKWWNYGDNAPIWMQGCNGGYNQTFSLAGSSGGQAAAELPLADPGVLWRQLKFAGEHENKYLSFQYTSTEVSIDPMGTMVDGGAHAQSGGCTEGSSVYDAGRTSGGKCCVHDNVYGQFQQAAWNKNLFYCR